MKDIQKDQKKRDTYTQTHILKVQSCHHTKRNQTNNKNMSIFLCQNRYNKYLQRKEEKTKQSKKEYSYLVVFC